MNKNFSRLYWCSLKSTIKASPWLAAGIIIFISFLIILIVEGRLEEEPLFLGLSKSSLLTISGSLLASSLFWVFNKVIHLLDKSRSSLVDEYFERIHNTFGLKEIFDQRGGKDILDLYEKLINKAERRVWAIGMSNQGFTGKNLDKVLERCKKIPDIEVKLIFWNPRAKMIVEDKNTHFHEIQAKLESGVDSKTDWPLRVDDQVKSLESKVSTRLNVKVYYVSIVTNISGLIVDDDIFFFPFLSRDHSNKDPHMHFDATRGIGKLIADHYAKILKSEYCKPCHPRKNTASVNSATE